jgi:2-O-methyltransferase
LDDWAALSGVEAVDFIWADVQGAEGDLIAGATNVLSNTKYFYTEYGTSEWYEGQAPLGDICNSLFDLGHVMLQKFGIDALFVNKNLVDISTLRFPIKQQSPCPCGSGKIYKKCHG